MESWRRVWRIGLAPLISTDGLTALRGALANDDQRLIQSATTKPFSCMANADCNVESACVLGYCGWQGDGLNLVGDIPQYVRRLCCDAEENLKERGGCYWFVDWYDYTPRDEMRRELLPEVELVLRERMMAEVNEVAS